MGVVSGLIAVAIAVVQLIVPNALVIILIATLSHEHPAVTWSVVSRLLGNSLWPVLLRSDMAASRRVPSKINFVTWIRPLSLALIAVAAIVTPVGLYEGLVLTEEAQSVTFIYLADTGTMGYGTPPRSNLGFSRQCWGTVPAQCPGTNVVLEQSKDDNFTNVTIINDDYDRRIPKALVKLYQSGLSQQSRSVSSYFDIQARQYQYENQNNINNSTYLVDSFRALSSKILDDSTYLIDGLVVDMGSGGVGFRKHTAPAGLQYGAEWDEDILFLQPETVCVNTNMTLEMQVSLLNATPYSSSPGVYLVDRGGFVNINKTNPWLDPWYEDMQVTLLTKGDPSLESRAYRAGWWMNVQNMYYFNVSKPYTNRTAYLTSELGQRFPVNNSYDVTNKDQLDFGAFDSLFDSLPSAFEWSNGTLDVFNNSYLGPPYWPNPWNVTSANYTDIESSCTGSLEGDFANMTNIDVRCGLMLGPSKRLDGTESSIDEPGSWWTRPIYSCASATKASIKTVRFNFNSTVNDGLNSLRAIQVIDKVYQNESVMPLWGVETPNMTLADLGPFWGLISPELETSLNLSTIRSEKLYIPASSTTVEGLALTNSKGTDFNPGVSGPPQIWNTLYDPSEQQGFIDYSGASNLALLSKWQQLSRNATGAAHIANLLWTDYAANYFVGTRSWLTKLDHMPPNLQRLRKRQEGGDSSVNGQVPVQVYQRRIQYHFLYGIPAAICLVMSAIICLGAIMSILLGRSSISRLRHYMWSLSAGRMLGAFLFPAEGDLHTDTDVWIDQVGGKNVRIVDPDFQQAIDAKPPTTGSYSQINQKEPASVGTTTAFEPGEVESTRPRIYMT